MKICRESGVAFTLILLLVFAGHAFGATIRVPGDYPTIQAAIDAASFADRVLVSDGTYTGEGNRDIDFKGKDISVVSENGPNRCIIDCEGKGRGFYFHSGEAHNSILSGFTITNGQADIGGGIYADASSPTITNCILRGNGASDSMDWAVLSSPYRHTVGLKRDGTLWTWGENLYGQLGCGTTVARTDPTQIGSDTDWAFVSAGYGRTVALKRDGSLWAWGDNTSGLLGDGTTEDRFVPTRIGSDTDWASISAGHDHIVALKRDGSLWAWGDNTSGLLGDGTTEDRLVPTRIGSDTDWTAISAGPYHIVALKRDGSLWAWGRNYSGQLGDGTTEDRLVPTRIGSDTDWTFVSAWFGRTVALKRDGTLWGWGLLSSYYTVRAWCVISWPVPTQIGTDTDWAFVCVGGDTTIAIKEDGSLWAWGNNCHAGSQENWLVATQIGTDTDWAFVSAGPDHLFALKRDGSLWAWRASYSSGSNFWDNYSRALGYETTIKSVPTQIGSDTDWASVSAGPDCTFGLETEGSLWAWGWIGGRRSGKDNRASIDVTERIDKTADWASVSAGPDHIVALKRDGSLWAWGNNYSGQLGDGTTENRSIPTQIGTDTDWAFISASNNSTIALKEDGSLWAWGYNGSVQLGDGTMDDMLVPTQIGTDTDWAFISASGHSPVALKRDGSLWALRYNYYGQLGPDLRLVPARIGTDTDWAFVSVSAAPGKNFGLKTDGSLWAWGDEYYHHLGDGTGNYRFIPTPIGTDRDWAAVSAGLYHTIALKRDGSLWAWGDNYYGQLGDGTTDDRLVPTPIGTDTDWAAVSAGWVHTVALKRDGSLWAWGNNAYGQLGDRTDKSLLAPLGTDGGAVYCYSASPVIDHCTIASNAASGKGGGIYCYSSSPTIKNTILWGNSPDQIFTLSSDPITTYSDVQGGYIGEGNIDADPIFVDPANGNYQIGSGSPCVDAGDPSDPVDSDGSRADIGPSFQASLGSPPVAPILLVARKGLRVSLIWIHLGTARGYTLFYAPFPDASYIGKVDMGNHTSASFDLGSGAAFYVAVQAYNYLGNSGLSNIGHFVIP